MFTKDLPEKQNSAFDYRHKKLLDKKDKVIRRGVGGVVIAAILLSFILFTKSLLISNFLVIIDASFVLSIPLCFLFVLIINVYFKERIEKERYRFCKMSKEKRGWVIH